MEWLEKVPALKSAVDIDIVLKDLYEQSTKIYQKNKTVKKPLSSVAFFPSEENSTTSSSYELVDLFFASNVYAQTGLSLDKFLMLSKEALELVVRKCNEKNQRASENISDVEKALKASLNK